MKSLSEMTIEELWYLFPIILVPHNPQWEKLASVEINFLSEKLHPYILDIHHIGSTAIKGIWSKPIIDIIIEVESKEIFPIIENILTQGDFIIMSKTASRISFNKGYTPSGFAEKVFHIHLRLKGDADEIYFRDYLNEHPEIAKDYENLKISLWKKFEHNRDAYTEAKATFVDKYTTLAKNGLFT